MQTPDLIHHAVDDEIPTLFGRLFLKDIDEHDIDHRLHKNIRTIRSDVIDTFHPARVVVILFDTEL